MVLKAEYVGGNIPLAKTTDTVKVTVFGVTQTPIFTNAQQPDDPKRFSLAVPPVSHDENGQISWDLPNYLAWSNGNPPTDFCRFFANAMEMQSTVKPPRDANPSVYYGTATHDNDWSIPAIPPNPGDPPPIPGTVMFTQERWLYLQGWVRTTTDIAWKSILPEGQAAPVWTDDFTQFTSTQANVVTLASSGSHLYFPDGPGYTGKDRNEFSYAQFYWDFRNAVYIKFYGEKFMVSNWSQWHSVMFLKPKDAQTLTRAPNVPAAPPAPAKVRQDLGAGWITKPITRDDDFLNW